MIESRGKLSICTLFDHRFMSRALCMINSVQRYSQHEIWALCLSDEAHGAMHALKLPGVHLLSLEQLQAAIPGLEQTRSTRMPIEFYYTCMAALHRYVFDHDPDVEATMYVDSDIKFFENPDRVFDEFQDASGAITPHNFPPNLRHLEKFGRFNAGWSAFRRTPNGEALLNWWLEKSIEWCYGIVDEENDRFANQRYLNRFLVIAPDVKILTHKGCNLGPWNIANYKLSEQGGKLFVDEHPLLFFHFHGMKRGFGFFYFDNHRAYGAPYTRLMRSKLYRPYVTELLAMDEIVDTLVQGRIEGALKLRGKIFLGLDIKAFLRKVKYSAIGIMDVIAGRAIFFYGSRTF